MAECNGGFDANFVTDVHDLLKCVVCNFVLKNPVQVIECGHRFCRECYEKMKEYALTRDVDLLCPLDRLLIDEKQVFPDKGIERRILDLQVKCDHLNDGCEWIIELRHLQDHINNECLFALVCCPNDGCNINSVRSELEEHKKICPMKEGSQANKIRKLEITMSELMKNLKSKDDQLAALTIQMKENDANSKTMMSEVMERLKTKDDQLDALTTQIKENETNSKTMMSEVMERLKVKDDQLNTLTTQMKENKANSKTVMAEFRDKLKATNDKLDWLITQMKEKDNKSETLEKKLKILDKNFDDNKKVHEDVKKDMVSLKLLQKTKLVGYFQWNITEFSRKRSLKRIDSLPFSTLNGYNCSLCAVWSGKNEFGVFIYLNVGERDDDLIWSFNMKVTFECCNGDDNVKRILDCSNSVGYTWRNKPLPKVDCDDFGFKKFLSGPCPDKFVKDDSIVVNCYIETMATQ